MSKQVEEIADFLGIRIDQVAQALGIEDTDPMTIFTAGVIGYLGFGPRIEQEVTKVGGKFVFGSPTMNGIEISQEVFKLLTIPQ